MAGLGTLGSHGSAEWLRAGPRDLLIQSLFGSGPMAAPSPALQLVRGILNGLGQGLGPWMPCS